MGDTGAYLAKARQALQAIDAVRELRFSSIYRTEPQGLREQPFFSNQVAELTLAPELEPEMLLGALMALEAAIGRERGSTQRFGPRVIDLDLLLFGNTSMNSPRLTLPHPRMLERAFVLLPLAELAPDLPIPGGETVREALGRIRYSLKGDAIFQDG